MKRLGSRQEQRYIWQTQREILVGIITSNSTNVLAKIIGRKIETTTK